MATYEELMQSAEQIRTNELPESNTHQLVGRHLKDQVEYSKNENNGLKTLIDNNKKEVDGKLTELGISVADLTNEIKDYNPPLLYGGYYNMSGVLISNPNAKNTGLLLIKGFSKLDIGSVISTSGAAVMFFDRSRQPITSLAIAGIDALLLQTIDLSVTDYNNAYFAAVSYYDSKLQFENYKCRLYDDNNLIKRMTNAESELSTLTTTVEDLSKSSINEIVIKNLYKEKNVIKGKEVYGDGTIKNQAESAIIEVPIISNFADTITVSGLPESGIQRYYTFKDSNDGTLITGTIPKSNTSKTISIPNNSVKLILSIYQRTPNYEKLDLSKVQIEYGSEITEFTTDEITVEDTLNIRRGNTAVIVSNKDNRKKINILIFGNSITETDSYTYNPDRSNPYTLTVNKGFRSNWPKWFAGADNPFFAIGEVRNYAKSGASFTDRELEDRQYLGFQIDEMIADLNPQSDGYFNGKTFNPDVIIVSIGTNDGNTLSTYDEAMGKTVMAGESGSQYIDYDATLANLNVKSSLSEAVRHSFMRLRKQFPDAICFYVTPIQRCSTESYRNSLEVMTQMARRYNFIVIDCNSESGIVRDFQRPDGSSGDLYDGLHPNENGQKKMANLILNKVVSHLLCRIEL